MIDDKLIDTLVKELDNTGMSLQRKKDIVVNILYKYNDYQYNLKQRIDYVRNKNDINEKK